MVIEGGGEPHCYDTMDLLDAWAMSETESLVVVIDDDADIRASLTGLLETVKLRTATFSSAAEFLASKRHDGPCCIVLDVRLPGLGGLEFQRQLRQEQIPTPIIFITGHGDVPMSVQAMKAGATEFLTKPIRDQEFLEAVQTALAREQQVMELLVAGRANKQIAG